MSVDLFCACLTLVLAIGDGAKAGTQENAIELAQRATALGKKGDYAGALEAHQGAVARDPGSAGLWMKWADFSLERFRVLDLQLRSTQSGLAVVLRLEGEGLQNGTESREALLRRSAAADPEQSGIWGELGVEQLRRGMREEAAATLKTARERQANDSWTLQLEATVAAAEGDWKEAENQLLELGGRSRVVLRRAVQSWPKALLPKEGISGEIWNCVRKGGTDCMDKMTLPAVGEPNGEEQLFAEERWEEMAALPEPSLEGTIYPGLPGQAAVWFRRGVALAELNDCARAVPSLERGLEAGRETAAYWLEHCYVAEVDRALNRLSVLGNQAVFHRVKGDFLVRVKEDAQSATKEYAKARQLQPRNAVFAERLAQAYQSLGELQQARQAAREALALDPRRPTALQLLASIAMNERDYHGALVFLSRKLGMTPNDGWTRVQMGIAYAQTGQPRQALEYLQSAFAAGYPDERGALHAMLAGVLRKLGREQEARSAAEEANRLSDLFQQHSQKSVDDHQ